MRGLRTRIAEKRSTGAAQRANDQRVFQKSQRDGNLREETKRKIMDGTVDFSLLNIDSAEDRAIIADATYSAIREVLAPYHTNKSEFYRGAQYELIEMHKPSEGIAVEITEHFEKLLERIPEGGFKNQAVHALTLSICEMSRAGLKELPEFLSEFFADEIKKADYYGTVYSSICIELNYGRIEGAKKLTQFFDLDKRELGETLVTNLAFMTSNVIEKYRYSLIAFAEQQEVPEDVIRKIAAGLVEKFHDMGDTTGAAEMAKRSGAPSYEFGPDALESVKKAMNGQHWKEARALVEHFDLGPELARTIDLLEHSS